MARRFTTGFELGETIEHNGVLVDSSIIEQEVQGTIKRTGNYAWRISDIGSLFSTSLAYYAYFTESLLDHPNEIFIRLAWRYRMMASATTSAYQPILVMDDESNNHHLLLAFVSHDATLRIYTGGDGDLADHNAVLLASSNVALQDGQWYTIGVHAKIGASGAVAIKINNATVAAFSGDTAASGNEHVAVVKFGTRLMMTGSYEDGGPVAAVGCDEMFFDDIAINDTAGLIQNSWIGVGGVKFAKAVEDGASSQWNMSAGLDHYALVDDVPDNANTDYIYDDVAAHLDLFALEDLDTVIDSVALIEPLFQAALVDAGSANVKHVVRHDGVDYDGDTEVITSVQPSYVLYKSSPIYEVLGGSGPWSRDQINALESGVEVV